ncbi:MAG: hypothetical protein MZV70_02255 [Desulfobacterales bacterium]|nr:hypothetical protein [Desulfobacterales bacterium]
MSPTANRFLVTVLDKEVSQAAPQGPFTPHPLFSIPDRTFHASTCLADVHTSTPCQQAARRRNRRFPEKEGSAASFHSWTCTIVPHPEVLGAKRQGFPHRRVQAKDSNQTTDTPTGRLMW